MKILFINSSLESGKDGVGDYTLRLASVLKGRGEDVLCLSMADRFISPDEQSGDPTSLYVEGYPVLLKRLSEKLSWRKRVTDLQNILNEFKPDWISLQYVPYGFNRRGLPFKLAGDLGALRGNFRWHIMFHELWIGEEAEYTKTQKMIGWLQKRIVRNLASATKAILHTSNPTYKMRLGRAGCPAEILPLFSNLPVAPPLFSRRDVMEEAGMDPESKSERVWIFALFGAIYPQWDAESLFERIENVAKREGNFRCLLLLLGRPGGDALLERPIQACVQRNWSFLNKGELPPSVISSYLQSADFGIATSPLSLIGKSGSAAAMQEHGLPVIVSRLEDLSEDENVGMGFLLLDHSFEENLMKVRKTQTFSRVDSTGDLLLRTLKA